MKLAFIFHRIAHGWLLQSMPTWTSRLKVFSKFFPFFLTKYFFLDLLEECVVKQLNYAETLYAGKFLANRHLGFC